MREEIKKKLIKHIDFLQAELKHYQKFKQFTWSDYRTDDDKRRSVERWIENIVNSSIDIAKLILTAEDKILPDTYKEIILLLALLKEFTEEEAKKLANWVKLRNIVAHEYLDIRWDSVKKFTQETETLYKNFLNKVKVYLERQIETNSEEK